MKFKLPENAFPELHLSKELQNELIEEAESVVRDTLAANEAFLADGAVFRDPRWKLVKTKDGLHVYHHQRTPTRNSTESRTLQRKEQFSPPLLSETMTIDSSGASSNVETGYDLTTSVSASTVNAIMKSPKGFQVALHGTVDGNLDDAMFGTFATTSQAWMWRSSHTNDHLDDARVLAIIRGPTAQDPFRFLGVKWFVKERPAMLAGIVQQRDYLILEATGFTRDSDGEKVGYYLMHSISLPRMVPELSELGLLRGVLSLCYIDRQRSHGKVEKYCRGFSNPRGKISNKMAVPLTADSLICAAKIVDYAYIKKLTWLMKHKGNQRLSRERQTQRPRPKHCQTCNKSFTKLMLSSAAAGVACQICRRVLCGRCTVAKKMTVDVSDTGAVKQCALRFCLECLREAKEYPAWEMVQTGINTSASDSAFVGF
ncbi:unnamed protein product [Peronospora belbahrii]|uniref:FYVE-type domain-containing protein n=1 Tax=Peronospora belbahrii TaxID=622444 RepID=A0AAU9L2L2_9STRA|nr:unnamed protein product [Peronospora belbahrii]